MRSQQKENFKSLINPIKIDRIIDQTEYRTIHDGLLKSILIR
jgi:hypothetical protein